MKNLLPIIIGFLFLFCGLALTARPNAPTKVYPDVQPDINLLDFAQEIDAEEDSIVTVAGCFGKNDTLIYWINDSEWRLKSGDTVKIGGLSTKIMLTVTDSTSTGYKMDYAILEMSVDSVEDDGEHTSAYNQIADIYGKILEGVTLSFETDEFGAITRFSNYDLLKKQLQAQYKEFTDGMKNLPHMNEEVIHSVLPKDVDTDGLLDMFFLNLQQLFFHYGKYYDIGDIHYHDDATATSYETDTDVSVVSDVSDGTYSIAIEVTELIPATVVEGLLGRLVDAIDNDTVTAGYKKWMEENEHEKDYYINTNYLCSDYFPDGVPYRVVRQAVTRYGDQFKGMQTVITLDYVNY